jgi:hypothetical protein
MTLEEFEKIREEKRKALLALKTEERKVEVDKDLQAMQLLSTKKGNDEVFVKLVILPVMPCTLFMLHNLWRCQSLIKFLLRVGF